MVPGQGITIACDGWQPGSEVTATFGRRDRRHGRRRSRRDGPAQVAVTGRNITVGLLVLGGLIVGGTVALLVGRRRATSR